MKEDLELELYILAETSYIKKMKEKDISFNDKNIFPNDWYKFTNYKDKIEILNEALEKNIFIKDTELYKKY